MQASAPRLLIVVNDSGFFVSHRLPVAIAAAKRGFEVHVATPPGPAARIILDSQLDHHEISMTRSGLNPFRELRTLLQILSLVRRIEPDVLLLVTIKPVIYGGLVARAVRAPSTLAAITGLGYTFSDTGARGKALRFLATRLYRVAIGHPGVRVIFQNQHDRELFIGERIVRREQALLIRGSGVDLNAFVPAASHASNIVMMASRLLWDKGLREFVTAAELVRQQLPATRFVLVGDVDEANPSSASRADILGWVDAGIVEWWGHQTNMWQALAQARIFVLPSYGEGMPKVLAEAAAMAIPTVTTDAPGCGEAVIPDVTGLVVPAKDPVQLAAAISTLLEDADRCIRMGRAGRELAEREFALDTIVDQHIELFTSALRARA